MARRKYKALRIGGWIIAGFISLILLITLVFYMGRGWIMNRAVTYLNENQPGEVQMGQMNLIPFMNFPNVSLQLRYVSYYEQEVHPDSLLQEPVLSLREIFVTLDVLDLIRGDIEVSQAKTSDGFIRVEVYEDSITNIEYALGIRFGEKAEKDSTAGLPALNVNMDKIELTNILFIMQDRTRDDHINVTINSLESNFSYLPDHVETGLKLDFNVNTLKYLTYRSETSRNIRFESEVILDPVLKEIIVEPSSVKISGLELEAWGTYDFLDEPHLDVAFKASNKGLEVLNYLFRGVLDLDEIEQIGTGSIYLSGNINGYLGDQLPVIRVNGSAEQIGFRIKSIEKNVTDISFNVYATNGNKLDYSEGLILVDGFSATFPEGTIYCNGSVTNMKVPELNLELMGDIDLAGLEKMLNTSVLDELEGHISLTGEVSGVINKNTGEFLNDAGSLRAILTDVGFIVNQDSAHQDSAHLDSVKNVNGEIYLQENVIGTKDLTFEYNGNQLSFGARMENLLLYLLDFDRDVNADISISSETLYPATFIRDTSLTELLGDELNGLHFSASALVSKQALDAFIHDDSIPTVQLSLDSFGIEIPVYSDISNMNAVLTIGPDSLKLHHLGGTIGESGFSFSGLIANYRALSGKDSSAIVNLQYKVLSDLMRAEDFFTFNREFVLPETYRTEYLEGFHLAGFLELPVSGLMIDSASLDFELNIEDLGWNFRYYPLKFEQFQIHIRRNGDLLHIDNFQGNVGESNLKMSATIGNFTDTLKENLYGNLAIESDLLDFNELLNYQLPDELQDTTMMDTTEVREPPRLDQIDYPQFKFLLDIGELRYGDYKIFGMNGRLRSTRDKIFYLDSLVTSAESGGSMEFSGHFNVSNPWMYTFSTDFNLKDVDFNDLDLEMQAGEETYTLKEKFAGLVSTNGLAEIFITPDFRVDMSSTTAVFNVQLKDGALINFTPLQAAAKYLDNKDLNHVRFATLSNSAGSFTLIDSRISIPMMNIESTVGQLLIEGEQGLDNSYLYLLRLPTWLVKGAAKSRLSKAEGEQEEDQIREMKIGNFLRMTAWGNGEESEVKLGDKRDKYQ